MLVRGGWTGAKPGPESLPQRRLMLDAMRDKHKSVLACRRGKHGVDLAV